MATDRQRKARRRRERPKKSWLDQTEIGRLHEAPLVYPASVMTVDFTGVPDVPMKPSGVLHSQVEDTRPRTIDGKLLTPKQIRERARRRMRRAKKVVLTDEEKRVLYKPVEEWDAEELARGRPRNISGGFGGAPPAWVDAKVHEAAMERFKGIIRTEMNATTVDAIEVIKFLMNCEDVDDRGRPMVPASVKLQAASFLLEHVVGKPTQRVETDISVKLQGLLATAIVNPNQALAIGSQGGDSPHPLMAAYQMAHLPGQTTPIGASDIMDGEVVSDE